MCVMISQLFMSSHDQMYFTVDRTVCLVFHLPSGKLRHRLQNSRSVHASWPSLKAYMKVN